MSKEVSQFDLQKYYPEELEILSVAEEKEELILFMKSRSISYTCPNCGCTRRHLLVFKGPFGTL